jgi:hypothetical protein
MLNVYLVERTDNVNHTEPDSFAVVAEDEEEAFELAKEAGGTYDKFGNRAEEYMFKRNQVRIEKIDLNKKSIILERDL